MKAITAKLLVLAVIGSFISLPLRLPAQAKGDPNWDVALKDANHLLAIGESEKAAAIFESKIKKYPNSGACHTALGRALKRLGKLDQAKTEFLRSTEVEPNYADGFYELGVLQESDKEWTEAANAFTRYVELKPDSGQRRTVEDRILYCKGQKE
ncbi:tetratricopeptide repeat protein [bacterium]|nr:tetratricopeptide repeat protein [bacterium]MBP9807940.1 tetratricopeptide repeat protein [bacterium]